MTPGLGFWWEAALNNLAAWFVTYLLYSTFLLGAVALGSRRDALAPETESALWRIALVLAPLGAAARVAIEHLGDVPVRAGPDALAVAGTVGQILVGAWAIAAVVSLALTARLGRAAVDERSRLSDRRPVANHDDLDFLDRIARGAGRSTPRLTASSSVDSPVAIGRNEICVPARGFLELDPSVRHAVLAHELGHLVHRDSVWTTLAHALERLFFLQPLHRLARRRMRESAEFRADAFAVRVTGRPDHLVAGLATLGRRSRNHLAPAFASGSLLLRRAERALAAPIREPRSRRGRLVAFATVLAALAWFSPAVVPAYDCHVTGALPDVTSWFLIHF